MSDNDIKISIICNAYNHEKYIRYALEGFIMQRTSFRFEVLIHDDASTDSTADIIREYEQQYPDIIKPIYQSVNQYSQHIFISRTYQLPRAKGKYIALCEGDDYWTDPLKLQKQYDFLEANPDYTLCGTAATMLNLRDNKEEEQFLIASDRDVSLEEIIVEENGRIFPTVSVLVHKEIFAEYPEWMQFFSSIGDLPLLINAGLKGKIRMLSDNTCVYRWFTESSWTVSMQNAEKRINLENEMINAFESLDRTTDGKYSRYIKKRLNKCEFNKLYWKRDYKNLKKNIYYKNARVSLKIKVFLWCKTPGIYKLLKEARCNAK